MKCDVISVWCLCVTSLHVGLGSAAVFKFASLHQIELAVSKLVHTEAFSIVTTSCKNNAIEIHDVKFNEMNSKILSLELHISFKI